MSNPTYTGYFLAAYTTEGIHPLSFHFDGLEITTEVKKMMKEFLIHLADTGRAKAGEIIRFNGTLETKPNKNFHFDGTVASCNANTVNFFPYRPVSVSSNY